MRARSGAIPLPAAVLLVLLTAWVLLYSLADGFVSPLAHVRVFGGLSDDAAFALAGLLLVWRGLRRRNRERAWLLLGIGAWCWAAGDVYWSVKLAALSSPPVPSPADAGYLLFCPLTFAGVVLLVRSTARGASRTMVLDAVAAALAAGALSAAFVLGPVLEHTSSGGLALATNLAYPVNDLILLGLLVGASALRGWRISRAWLLLGASIVSFWIADSFYLTSSASNSFSQYAWFNPFWNWSPILAAWAAWLPSVRTAERPSGTGARGLVMLPVFAAAALALLVWGSVERVALAAVALAAGSLVVVTGRLVVTWRENLRLLHASRQEALTDALTGLPNRRALVGDLDRLIPGGEPLALALFDLDGFKHYNDNFGHPAGDVLLQRLGLALAEFLEGRGTPYRMGGDEFCALVPGEEPEVERLLAGAARALGASGEGFSIGCSYGFVSLPREAGDGESALRIADQRMYAHKRGGRNDVSRQTGDVLLRALAERDPELGSHLRGVGELAAATAVRLGLPGDEVELVRTAAELHDVGKVAIPDVILDKPAALDEREWDFIRRHTLIGERIITAAPALRRCGPLVRSSHENWDGSGYPDTLVQGEIPLGARIIAVCDAYDAMTSDRPYRRAMSHPAALGELRRCAGTQFDPTVVERFCEVFAAAAREAGAAPPELPVASGS